MNAHEPPRAVVFDFNGTISDDEPLLAELCTLIFGEIGIEVTEERYFGEFAGYSDPEIVERVLAAPAAPTPPSRRACSTRRTSSTSPAPATGETVHAAGRGMRARDRRRACRSRSPPAPSARRSRPCSRAPACCGALAAVVTADDVARGKPDPEGYLIALDRLGVRALPTRCRSRTPTSASMAAVAAGMRCVGVGATVSAESGFSRRRRVGRGRP